MAKLKGPLFSMDASGKLADSLVYMKWKGINDVRQHVIPANPRTEKQQAQRSRLKEAVDLYHATAFNTLDLEALELWASTMPKVMSGFNTFIKAYIDAKVAGVEFTPFYQCSISGISESGFTVKIKSDLSANVKIYYGTSKTTLTNEVEGSYNSGTKEWTFTLTGLASGTKYYFYVKSTSASDVGRSGIYTATTT